MHCYPKPAAHRKSVMISAKHDLDCRLTNDSNAWRAEMDLGTSLISLPDRRNVTRLGSWNRHMGMVSNSLLSSHNVRNVFKLANYINKDSHIIVTPPML
jgi:hypothetical protein